MSLNKRHICIAKPFKNHVIDFTPPRITEKPPNGVLTITTDNGFEFAAHQYITRGLNEVNMYFADSYCYWQKGLVEYTNQILRQYIPKGFDFKKFHPRHLKMIQHKLNKRPSEKFNFSMPLKEFFKHFY